MNLILLACLFLMHGSLSCADLKKHFKTPTDTKADMRSVGEVDCIYMINLDQRPEKFASCTKQLLPYGINPYRFSAVNGWELSIETINTLGVKFDQTMKKDLWGTAYLLDGNWQPHHEIIQVEGRNYFCHCMARGPVGIVLSHLSVLSDAYKSNHKRIWVMEDDIEVKKDPHHMSSLIKKLNALVGEDKWDILFTDRDTKNQKGEYVPCLGYARKPNFTPTDEGRFARRTKVGQDFTKVGARYGAYSMIIQRSGMKKILNFFDKYSIFLPYDMEFYLPNDIHMYAVTEDVVSTQPNALSDNGAPAYLDKEKLTKELITRELIIK